MDGMILKTQLCTESAYKMTDREIAIPKITSMEAILVTISILSQHSIWIL